MSGKKVLNKRLVYIFGFGIAFLLLSLWVGLFLVSKPQNLNEKAAYPVCPGGEQCPMVGNPNHLLSCHPGEADGSPSDSLCNEKGRVETCGPNYTKYCCPAVGGSWTTIMTACPTPPSPVPTPSPTPVRVPPTPLSPLSNITCPASSAVAVNFSWTAVNDSVSYLLNIDDLSNGWGTCSAPNANDYCLTVSGSTSRSVNLLINKNYRWGVAANYAGGILGPTSTIVNFTIGASCTPTASPTAVPSPVPTKSPSPNPTRSPSPSPLQNRWDVDQNGIVNIIDIGIVIDNYGKIPITFERADVNLDGLVNIIDIGIIIDHYTF